MTFKPFNIAHGLSQTPEAYKLYDPENPPFNISCLSRAALNDFKQIALLYEQFFTSRSPKEEGALNDEVVIEIPEKKQILNLDKLSFEEKKMSHWHVKIAKILSQKACWESYFEMSGKNAEIKELQNELFAHISYAAFKIESLCEQYKLLKLMTRYHRNCLNELTQLRERKWTHSKASFMGYKIPGFFCENFGNFLEEYLKKLGASIHLEKQKLASAMVSRLLIANKTKDINNGDLLFFIAKKIDDLCKEKVLISEVKAKKKEMTIQGLRAWLNQDQKENPGAHAILDWQLVPKEPQRSLDYKAYKIFWQLIVSLPEDDISKSIKNKFANLGWFTKDSGIKVETIKYPEGFILVPKVDHESEIISNNAKALKMPFIPQPGAVIEMNEGLHILEKLMRTCFVLTPSSIEKDNAQSLSQKLKAPFQVWLKGQKIEDIKNLAEAIDSSAQGILYLCELLKRYDFLVPKKSIVEKQLYDLWSSELKRALTKFNKYNDIFIILFKELIAIPEVIRLAPIMRAIKQYAERLGETSFSFADKGKVESLFGMLHQEKIDAYFFSLFVDNLRNPKSGFITKTKDTPELYTHDTEDSRRLIDLLAVMSRDSGPVIMIGDVWKGTRYPSLYDLKRAFKVFIANVPSQSVDEVLHLLLKCLLRTLETEDSPGFGLLTQYHQEELLKNPDSDTLLTQWRSVQNNNYSQTICKELELLIKQHEDNYIRTRGPYEENPMFLEFTRLSNLLPDILDLEENQKSFLIHALNRLIDKKTEIDHWNLLPILIKTNDLDTARKYLAKRLIPLLRDSFLTGLANPSERGCFIKLFEKFPSLKKEIQKDIFSKVFDLLNTLKASRNLETILRSKFNEGSVTLAGIAKIAEVCFDNENQQNIGNELDNLFFSQLKTCVTNHSYLDFLLKNNQEFPLQKTFSAQLNNFVLQFEKTNWNFQQAAFLYLLKDKFGIDELRQKYFIQGLKFALKDMFVAGEFLEFYKEFGFKTGLKAIYGSYASEALRILESSFSDHDFTAVNRELVSFHLGDIALALNDEDLVIEDKKRYEAIRTNCKTVNDLKINFDNRLSQLIQYELINRDSLMEVFLNFNGSIKFVGNMICVFYAKIHKKLEQIGNSLTDSNDRNHNKHVIDITYKNLELLLEFIDDLLSKQTITANQAKECKQPIQLWIECLPSLRKLTYND